MQGSLRTIFLVALLAASGASLAQSAASQSRARDPNLPSGTTGASPSADNEAAGNAQVMRHLAAVVPSGMTAQTACEGFKTVDACAATLHAAQNLSIPFQDLKSRVAGGERLGQAIHTLKPAADARAEEQRAQQQALSDTQTHGPEQR